LDLSTYDLQLVWEYTCKSVWLAWHLLGYVIWVGREAVVHLFTAEVGLCECIKQWVTYVSLLWDCSLI
jgi:hypothetical protein